MPLVTFDRTFYAQAYRLYAGEGLHVGYIRRAMLPLARFWADGLIRVWKGAPPAVVIVVNAGFGFLAEALQERGVRVVAVETSSDLLAAKDSDERTEIEAALLAAGKDPTAANAYLDGARAKLALVNEDLATRASRDRVATLAGAGAVILTDHLMHYLTNVEAQAVSTRLNALAPVAHLVTPLQTLFDDERGLIRLNQGDYNWKTLADWKALIPADTWVSDAGFEVR